MQCTCILISHLPIVKLLYQTTLILTCNYALIILHEVIVCYRQYMYQPFQRLHRRPSVSVTALRLRTCQNSTADLLAMTKGVAYNLNIIYMQISTNCICTYKLRLFLILYWQQFTHHRLRWLLIGRIGGLLLKTTWPYHCRCSP